MSKNILYYSWYENSYEDCVERMRALGHTVDAFCKKVKNYDFDEEIVEIMMQFFSKKSYDCIFSFDYFPVISWFCQSIGVKYISWVYDSPLLTLNSVSVNNSCNEIYLFDRGLCEEYKKQGCSQIQHMPLGYNRHRMDSLFHDKQVAYEHDITFLGRLYSGEQDDYSKINYLPENLKVEIDGLIEEQKSTFKGDLFDDKIDQAMSLELQKYLKFDLGPYYKNYRESLIKDIFRKRVTTLERREYLETLSGLYPVDLYSDKNPNIQNISFKGIASYKNDMPQIFRSSKINLNLTVRSNKTGLPLRIIDILGAGGFCLTNYQEELEDYFENDKSIVWYDNKQEFLDKAAFYLAHDAEREKIAARGHEIATMQFDYDILLRKII